MLCDVVRPRRRWVHAPVIHAASHFGHKKRVAWVPISMHTRGSVSIIMELRLAALSQLLGFLHKLISLKSCPKNFQKFPKSCSFHEKVAQKLLFINSKKSVSTTDESKSLHIYNKLFTYLYIPFYSLTFLYLQR